MANVSPFLSKPEEWVEQLGEISTERKKLEDREENLKKKLKLHMKEQGVESVAGEKYEFKRSTGERVDFSQGAFAETFGAAALNEAITKLPKKPYESFRLVELKLDTSDPKVKEIVEHFSPQPAAVPAPTPKETPQVAGRPKKVFPRLNERS